ncbi:MAG: PQQ-dependent sugar dehydrogenase [Planctomycetes bacterium]|nr:PQQ-dependent sugar dehydrogenase [Planctomycetota bacterium]
MRVSLQFLAKAVRVLTVAAAVSTAAAQNQPPLAPVITEPIVGRIINPADLHMETGPFSDPNPGDTHVCTDWEVWTVTPSQRVWVTACIGGVERLHTHLGDGVFENSHAGRRTLLPDTQYTLRVRHRDSSGVAATEWSAWSTRDFTTGAATATFPLETDDVRTTPTPTLRETSGVSYALASGAVVRVRGDAGGVLLDVTGRVSGGNQITNPAALAAHEHIKVQVQAGAESLTLPKTDLAFTNGQGVAVVIYLPALSLAPGAVASYWVSSNGSTFVALPGQTQPDFSTLARGASVAWTTASDFSAEIVATGFQLPVNIAFVPNPRPEPDAPAFYVVELYGQIKVVRRNGVVSDYATGLLNFNPTGNFPGSGEQGVACAAVDPTNGDLFVTLLYSEINGDETSPHHPAVDRFTSTDGGITAATRTRVLDLTPEVQGQSHQISNITFGPDGYLYVHVGDGFDANSSQLLTQARGKVLRMTRTGQAISTNPFYSTSDGLNRTDLIFARGLRNPFGGAWRYSDAAHYMVENGPSVDRFSRLVSGRNYGYNGSDASMATFALYNWNPSTAPVNITFVQPEVFGGSGFPASYYGRAYVTQSGGTYGIGPGSNTYKVITEWQIDSTGVLTSGPRPVAYYNGGGASSAVAIAAGPDGLYFSDFYKEDSFTNPIARGSNILRLRYSPPPPPPDCNGNGVPDATDLANGTSRDCDGNGIPDECDIAAGRATDCNGNGVPDSCDTQTLLLANFNTAAAPFQLNGNAALVNGAVRLTTATGNLIGTAIRPPLSQSPMSRLNASFDFRIGNGSGADGMCFAAFDSTRYTQSALFSEEGPGTTSNTPPSGPGTLVVQFDTYDNGGGEGENTIEIMSNGVTMGRYTPSFDMEDYVYHHATVLFDGETISVRVTNASGVWETAFDHLPVTNYTPFAALLGFGGRTGGATNEHWLDNVAFAVPGPNDANANGIPDDCECPADFNRDGGVDGGDVEAFYLVWIAGLSQADVNFDGGVDGADVARFFEAWEAGGCP